MTPGIYWDLPAAEYHAAPGLSNSVLTSFLVSPYRCWFETIRPDREPRKETLAMKLGTALHAAVLEPDTFLDRYNWYVTKDDFEGCLDTIADLKAWLQERQVTFKSTDAKPALIAAVLRANPEVKILEVELRRHAAANHGKILLDKVEWQRIYGMAKALQLEPELQKILCRGRREVSVFVKDPETGILLKCRVDWMQQRPCPYCTDKPGKVRARWDSDEFSDCANCNATGFSGGTVLDLKTFSEQGTSIKEAILKALRYRGYIRQAWFYLYVLKAAGLGDFTWINAFVESEAPYEVRLRSMGPQLTEQARYWERTGLDVLKNIRDYAKLQRERGIKPWAYQQAIEPVLDSELPALAFKKDEGDE